MKLTRINSPGGAHWGYKFTCPGCSAFKASEPDPTRANDGTHGIPTVGPNAWGFNGDVDRPTFTPSILQYEIKRHDGTVYAPRCHSFVRDGRIEFSSDCGHALAGQTVDLPDVLP